MPTVVKISVKGHTVPNSGSGSLTTAFATLPASGNAIIVCIETGGATAITSVTDNQTGSPNAYASKVSSIQGIYRAVIYECPVAVVNAATFVVTVTFGGTTYSAAAAIEVSGLSAAGTLNASGTAGSAAGTTAPSVSCSGAGQATDLVVAVLSNETGSATAGITKPGAYTEIFIEQNGNLYNAGEACYKQLSGAETSTATWSQTSTGFAACIASFAAAAGSTSSFLAPRRMARMSSHFR